MHLEFPDGPAWEFLLLFAVVVTAPRIVEFARLPGLVGLLLGGFAIGPHGLNLITAGQATVPELGQLGLLYLMFVAGLELDLAQLRAYRRSALTFGLLTFSIPMALGTGSGLLLGWSVAGSLLLGSLLASHTLVTYQLVKERGLGPNPAVATAVGATVLTDTLALVVLAAVSGSQAGGSAVSIGLQLIVGMAVVVGGSMVLLPVAVRWGFRLLGDAQSARYVLLIAAFLAAAALAEVFGIEGIVGAFFAGLAVNRLVPNNSRLMHRVEFFGSALFVPVFIVSIGFILDPSVLVQLSTLTLAGILIAACLGGKAIAAWAARLFGFSGPQSGVLFALTTPQAAATLAATTVGLQLGLFQTAVVNAVLVLILVSLVVSPIAVRYFAPRVDKISVSSPLGSRVLAAVPTGLSAPRAHTLLRVAVLATRMDGGTVQPVLIRSETDRSDQETELKALQDAATLAGIDSDAGVVVDRSLAQGTVHAAVAHGASLVLVPDDQDPDAASWAEAVAAVSPAPVALVRGTGKVRRAVLLDDDGLPDDTRALASELADRVDRGGAPERRVTTTVDEGEVLVTPIPDWTLPADVARAVDAAGAVLIAVPPPAAGPGTQDGLSATLRTRRAEGEAAST